MELTKPNFCTVVMPNEYDYIRQFNESIKASNKFHNTMNVDPKCPPPYFPVDMGKVYGLLSHIAALESRLKEAEALNKADGEFILDIINGNYNNAREITAVENYARHYRNFRSGIAGGDTDKI